MKRHILFTISTLTCGICSFKQKCYMIYIIFHHEISKNEHVLSFYICKVRPRAISDLCNKQCRWNSGQEQTGSQLHSLHLLTLAGTVPSRKFSKAGVTQTLPKHLIHHSPLSLLFVPAVQFKHQLHIVLIWKSDDKIHYDISPSWRLCSQDSYKKKKKKALYIFCFTIVTKKRVLIRVTFAFSGTSGEQLPLSSPFSLSMLGDFTSRNLSDGSPSPSL